MTRRIVFGIFILSLVALEGCGGSGNSGITVEVTSGPSVTMNPNSTTPLAGLMELETNEPAQVTLTIEDGTSTTVVEFPDASVSHSLPILGLKPNSANSITVELIDSRGRRKTVDPSISVTTDPLPEYFPDLDVHLSNPEEMEPGFTLLDRFRRARGADPSLLTYSIILNAHGEVVWFAEAGDSNMRQIESGNLLFRTDSQKIEMDMLGSIISDVELMDPDLHHDLFPTEMGTFLSISRLPVTVDNYPTNYDDPIPRQTVEIRDDPIVEFSADGQVIGYWPAIDLLDASRIGYIALGETPQGLDWQHSNAVIHDPLDDSIIVSVRHQDAVVKFSRASGQLIWILGPHINWTEPYQPFLLDPVDPNLEWQYHQHAPMITPEGTLIMFDNGNNRSSPFDDVPNVPEFDNYSRAVEYAIDEERMEVRQVWEYGRLESPRLYADFIGDADVLPETGNALITFGGTKYIDGVKTEDLGFGEVVARIVEVTREAEPTKVFEVMLSSTEPGTRISVYRSERIPSLYPPEVSVMTTD